MHSTTVRMYVAKYCRGKILANACLAKFGSNELANHPFNTKKLRSQRLCRSY